MGTAHLEITALSAIGGAQVSGIDLSREIDDATGAALRDAFKKFGLLLFRGQELSPEQQLTVAGVFGTISYQGENYKNSDGTRYVSNVAEDGLNKEGELTFHVDHSFYQTPLRAIMLYALEVPPPGSGGETMFASMGVAYKALPDSLRARIENLEAVHCYDFAVSRNVRQSDRMRERDLGPLSSRATHPVAYTHPDTGERVLFISRRHVDRIIGLPEDESESLLSELIPYIEDASKVLKHAWQRGDLVIWDNMTFQHARTNFDPKHKRHLRRCQMV